MWFELKQTGTLPLSFSRFPRQAPSKAQDCTCDIYVARRNRVEQVDKASRTPLSLLPSDPTRRYDTMQLLFTTEPTRFKTPSRRQPPVSSTRSRCMVTVARSQFHTRPPSVYRAGKVRAPFHLGTPFTTTMPTPLATCSFGEVPFVEKKYANPQRQMSHIRNRFPSVWSSLIISKVPACGILVSGV